jgi:hypothetical protein
MIVKRTVNGVEIIEEVKLGLEPVGNEDGTFDCDLCERFVEVKFCMTCGVDYCADCRLTHDAMHEEVKEILGSEFE